jgi:hypothetical protein
MNGRRTNQDHKTKVIHSTLPQELSDTVSHTNRKVTEKKAQNEGHDSC